VIEGDEYDSAFFDKRSKFIHYAPHIAVLNNLEFDHADIFRDLDDVKRTFTHLTRIVPRNGWIVMNGDDDNLRALGPTPWTRVVRVGTGEGCDVRITDFVEQPEGVQFDLTWRGVPWSTVKWNLPGLYNARNAAMAATAAGLALHPDNPVQLDLGALARFRGVKRRQEILTDSPALTVIEDFGHHPTALAETLRSLRARYPGRVIHAAFEPRSNTSRTRIMQTAFMRSLALADEVYLGAIANAHRLKPEERFDADGLMQFLESQGVHGCTAETNAALLEKMVANTRAPAKGRGQLVVFFTNGSFDGIIAKYVAAMKG